MSINEAWPLMSSPTAHVMLADLQTALPLTPAFEKLIAPSAPTVGRSDPMKSTEHSPLSTRHAGAYFRNPPAAMDRSEMSVTFAVCVKLIEVALNVVPSKVNADPCAQSSDAVNVIWVYPLFCYYSHADRHFDAVKRKHFAAVRSHKCV